eukprot:TRINITY_DN27398_c0_g1_i1.p1 TRINITY_DN27398_c0_g1~~TRINITY_DN27398_c0_g1_i1.p1  ORF type:complete len:375 (+),score=73.16 TRINITY_DN27398_c0_g1_i1:71-1126(+)
MPPKNRRRGRGRGGKPPEGGGGHQHEEPGEVVLPATVTQIAPCKHNEWMCSDRRKHFVTLKCLACDQKWKTRLKEFTKCPDFHAEGRYCPRGDQCPHPHVYARSRISEAPSRKAAALATMRVKSMPSKIVCQDGQEPEQTHARAQTLPNGNWGLSHDPSASVGLGPITELLSQSANIPPEQSLLFIPEPHRANTDIQNQMYSDLAASLLPDRALTMPAKHVLLATSLPNISHEEATDPSLGDSLDRDSTTTGTLSRCGTAPDGMNRNKIMRSQTEPKFNRDVDEDQGTVSMHQPPTKEWSGSCGSGSGHAGETTEMRRRLVETGGLMLDGVIMEKSVCVGVDTDPKSPIRR